MSTLSFFVASLLAPIINYVTVIAERREIKNLLLRRSFAFIIIAKNIVYILLVTH